MANKQEIKDLIALSLTEKRTSINKSEFSFIDQGLQSGNGLQKLLKDFCTLSDWAETLLGDPDLLASIQKNYDLPNATSQDIVDGINQLTKDLKIPRYYMSNEAAQKTILVFFVHDEIQRYLNDPKNKDLEQKIDKGESAQEKAWKDFAILNEIVFRRYRQKEENLQLVQEKLTSKAEGLQEKPIIDEATKFYNGFLSKKLQGKNGLIEDFFNPEEVYKQCLIDKNGTKQVRVSPTEYKALTTEPSQDQDTKTAQEQSLDQILMQLEEVPVIALFKSKVEKGISERMSILQKEDPGTITKISKATLQTAVDFYQSTVAEQHYGTDWSEDIKKKIEDEYPEDSTQHNLLGALERIMRNAPHKKGRIRSIPYYTKAELTNKQQQAYTDAHSYFKAEVSSLKTAIDENNIEKSIEKIKNLEFMTKKLDSIEMLHKKIATEESTEQLVNIQEVLSAAGLGKAPDLDSILKNMQTIKSQRTYNACLETLQSLKQTITNDGITNEVRLLTGALEKHIEAAEKKQESWFSRLINWFSSNRSKAPSIETAKKRSRFTIAALSTYKESKISEELGKIKQHIKKSNDRAVQQSTTTPKPAPATHKKSTPLKSRTQR